MKDHPSMESIKATACNTMSRINDIIDLCSHSENSSDSDNDEDNNYDNTNIEGDGNEGIVEDDNNDGVEIIDLTNDDDDDNDNGNDNEDDDDIEENTTKECPICFEEIPENSIKFLPCMHSFHDACVTTWTDINDTCPVCKNNNNATQRE
jgi:hypothetical protein